MTVWARKPMFWVRRVRGRAGVVGSKRNNDRRFGDRSVEFRDAESVVSDRSSFARFYPKTAPILQNEPRTASADAGDKWC